jgi:hypothetical protein
VPITTGKQLEEKSGGERGIRTLDTGVSPYNGLANRRLQPLGHLSGVLINNVQNYDCVSPKIYCVFNVHTLLTMEIAELLRRNRARRKQVGEIIETHTAFFDRYYTSVTYDKAGEVVTIIRAFSQLPLIDCQEVLWTPLARSRSVNDGSHDTRSTRHDH